MNKFFYPVLFVLTVSLISFTACNKDGDEDTRTSEEKIQEYLADYDIEATRDSSGLYYYIKTPGNGTFMDTSIHTRVKLYYTGYLTTGNVFDAAVTSPANLTLANTIEGWQIGIPLFDQGAEGSLIIPSELGYGATGYGSIPGSAILIFDIRIVDFLQ